MGLKKVNITCNDCPFMGMASVWFTPLKIYNANFFNI